MGCIKSKPSKVINSLNLSSSTFASMKDTNSRNFVVIQHGYPADGYETLASISNVHSEITMCLDKSLQAARAVKRIPKHRALSLEVKLFERSNEVKICQTLSHPYIPHVYSLYETPENYYIVMDYSNGKELINKAAELKEFSEEKASIIMRQLLSTVAYLHNKRIVHRNIQPEHILLEEVNNTLKINLVGFGSAALLTATKMSDQIEPSYFMAPEVINESYNEKCDEWSCGIIMYILLTGQSPYPGKNDREILEEMRVKPFQLENKNLRGVSTAAVLLLHQLLQPNPISRISAATAITHPWIQQIFPDKSAKIPDIIERFRNFQKPAEFFQVVTAKIAHSMPKDDIKRIKKLFQSFDLNNDGYISKNELLDAICSSDESSHDKMDINRLIATAYGLSDNISYSEFEQLCWNQTKYTSKERLINIFNNIDTRKQEKIINQDLENISYSKNDIPKEAWNDKMTRNDIQKNGYVDLDEFDAYMKNNLNL